MIFIRSSFLLDVLSSYNVGSQFVINGHTYDRVSFATDGIYPSLRIFFKPYTNPQGPERSLYTDIVESVRKDIERAFGGLQSRFHILRHEALLHDRGDLCDVWIACVLLHNLIVEDERSLEDPMGAGVSFLEEDVKEPGVFSRVPQQYVTNNMSFPLYKLIEHYHHLYDHNAHETLKYDLMCRIWAHRDAIITSVKKDSLQ
jgi:hypothetical protein